MPSAAELRSVRFGYPGREVLHEIGLHVDRRELVGLLGPNGAGKSTVLKLLSGVLDASAGSIRIAGEEISRIPVRELARQVAVVPQEPRFGFDFTALEIALLGRHPHQSGIGFESRADIERALESLDRCGAGALAGRSIHELSSGERQRVVFARALVQDCPLLLLDEPASFLDIRHQIELYDLVRDEVKKRDRAVLCVLHDLNLAAEFCDRICLLKDGAVVTDGPTDEVLDERNLTHAFDTELRVERNPHTGRPLVIPLPSRIPRADGEP